MAEVLREYFGEVIPSDVHDYGRGYDVCSFTGDGPDAAPPMRNDWTIINPPFKLALQFAIRALQDTSNVALLLRSNWAEGAERYNDLFSVLRPAVVAQFVERVPMQKGKWDPDGSSATSYSWFVWVKGSEKPAQGDANFLWIPPGCRKALTHETDVARFASWKLNEGLRG